MDACLQIIFSDECTEAEGHSWHTKHFVCCDCDLPLGGQRYVMTDGRPFCCVCYERLYAAECASCRQTIHVTDGHMVHGSRRWHAIDSCFRCDLCACSLLGCPFIAVPGKDAIFCANCGVNYKAAISGLYTDKRDGVVGPNCLSPSSPMMKVQKPSGKALFYSKFEGVDGKQDFGQTWCEDSPVKGATKYGSPRSSPLQCKPSAAELQTHTNSISCCDDHRLSGEFEVCASSCMDNTVLVSETPTSNEKLLPRISPSKDAVGGLRSASAQAAGCGDGNDATAAVSNPRPPVLVASGADYLDSADEINARLEELVVEPLWSHDEPDGLAAGCVEVAGVPDDMHQRSRKSKNLNVRFDPSTKDPSSPMPHGVCYNRWQSSSRRSLDDSDIPYSSYGGHHHFDGLRGSASVRIGRRGLGHNRHRGLKDVWSDAGGTTSHRASMHQASGWWPHTVDDYEHCSTCSSSSTDSDFDYGDPTFNGKPMPLQSQTLPQRCHNVGTPMEFSHAVQRSKKHKKKHCTVS